MHKGVRSRIMFDKAGGPINETTLMNLRSKANYSVIAMTPTRDGVISTVWTGTRLDINAPREDEPLIFETTYKHANGEIEIIDRYRTLKEAKRGHDRAVSIMT